MARNNFQLLANSKISHRPDSKCAHYTCSSSIIVVFATCTCRPIILLQLFSGHPYTIVRHDHFFIINHNPYTSILHRRVTSFTHQYGIVGVLNILSKHRQWRIIDFLTYQLKYLIKIDTYFAFYRHTKSRIFSLR